MPALDGVRALAALVVVGFHARWFATLGGFIGVDVFFVLSGFLITSLLRMETERTGTLSLGVFWFRRLARLWPALLVVCVAVVLAAPLFWPSANLLHEILLPTFYVSDYSKALFASPDIMQHSWSLAVEMQFYLLWPVVILASRSISNERLAGMLFAAFLTFTVIRIVGIEFFSDWGSVYYRADCRLSGLILGGLLAIKPIPAERLMRSSGLLALLVLALCTYLFRWATPLSLSLGTTLVQLTTVVLISAIVRPKDLVHGILSSSVMVTLGLWSYSLYLWHYPVVRALREYDLTSSERFALALCVAIPLSALTYTVVERPAYRFAKKKMAGKPRDAVGPHSAPSQHR
ncbi:acyltransferase family protein [Pararhizobium mangrovi]|nr:acyltransferase [Pararhizobium mangrovi]